jgi:hypothetical protein
MSFEEMIDNKAAKVQRPLSYIVRIVLLISIVYAIYAHLWRVLFIDILLLILVLIPTIVKRYDIELPKEVDFILLGFVVISFFLGDIRGIIIQAFFGLAIGFVSLAFILIITNNSKIKINYLFTYVAAISISMGLGATSELAKFLLKNYLGIAGGLADYHYAMASLGFVFLGSFIATSLTLAYLNDYDLPILRHLIKRFKKKNPNLFIERLDSPEEVLDLISKGENDRIEFKSTLRTNLHTGDSDRRIEHSVLKTIAAFLNTEGGSLLIGVMDTGGLCGIEKDHFQNNDKFNLHFTNLIKEYIGNENLPYLHFELIQMEDKNIMKVDCLKSKKPVFLKFHKEEEFYMRVGAATTPVTGSRLVSYIRNKFG